MEIGDDAHLYCKESSGCHKYQDHWFFLRALQSGSHQSFSPDVLYKQPALLLTHLTRAHWLSQEGQEQINESLAPFSQHWQIKLFSCCFVFPLTLAYSFELKVTCLVMFVYLFIVVLRIEPRAFSWRKLPALVLNSSINFFQNRENKIHQ